LAGIREKWGKVARPRSKIRGVRLACERATYVRSVEVKARLSRQEREAFNAWRKRTGLTTSQVIRALIFEAIHFGRIGQGKAGQRDSSAQN
jgi:hypothetical protein